MAQCKVLWLTFLLPNIMRHFVADSIKKGLYSNRHISKTVNLFFATGEFKHQIECVQNYA